MKILRRLTLALGLTFACLAVPETAHAGYTNGTQMCWLGDSIKVTGVGSGLVYISIAGHGISSRNVGTQVVTFSRTEAIYPNVPTWYGVYYVDWAVYGLGHIHRWANAQCVR